MNSLKEKRWLQRRTTSSKASSILRDPLSVTWRQILTKKFQRREKFSERTSQLAIAIYFKEYYDLPAKRKQVTIPQFHGNKTELFGILVHPQSTVRTFHDAVSPRLEKVLLHWVLEQKCWGFEMNGDIICKPAKKYKAIANERVLRGSQAPVMFSKG